ncbi:heparan-alpha-glucosaminide N-acetyltransferase [Arsenicitalea aurantiaca]|nr:heparan-alpha-glucosaminide N-acetyltransferase [Arsenicitalea aurantiaca]
MTQTATAPRPDLAPTPRVGLIDALRGAAITGMIVYHLAWDLSYFWFIAVDVSTDPGWVAFARLLVGIFLFLVGASLVLAHGRGIRWRAFFKRFAMLVGAALLISIATFVIFPQSFVFFGILHAIALLSLLALPFLRAHPGIVLGLAVASIALPFLFRDAAFDTKWLAWIGLWEEVPVTNDLVPVFPWFGVVLLGVLATRAALATGFAERLARVRPSGPAFKGLVLLGRWSLVIYLIHQPILLGILYPAAQVLAPAAGRQEAEFLTSCEASCAATRGDAVACAAYCGCSLQTVIEDDLWAAIAIDNPGDEQTAALGRITGQCAPLLEGVLAPAAP